MTARHDADPEFERRLSGLLLDVLMRAGFVLAMVIICFQVFSPFLSLMIWALIVALGYQIFMGWIATNPDAPRASPT
jgi:hypothetical protein